MQFLTLATLFAATAIASPLAARSTELVSTSDAVIVRNSDESVASISFTLSLDSTGETTGCTTGADANPDVNDPKFYYCDKKEYFFRYNEQVGYARFKLALVHQTSAFGGLQGNMTIGCNGPLPKVCSQVGKAEATLCSDDSCT
ncbi:hypothetical protein DM02DRAFT_675863 [Periconia macrospinosa]|uniref:AA1-like domain-containing protein n=1 Tax=Periconia macrospinosa TaxID=97972 RepID=A0A2V1DA01_9PLEO|nr:hypothetical protein DM02DRAFT_675863 [Periconia macrospinosa]